MDVRYRSAEGGPGGRPRRKADFGPGPDLPPVAFGVHQLAAGSAADDHHPSGEGRQNDLDGPGEIRREGLTLTENWD